MKALYPVYRLFALAFIDFQLRTINPMAPHLHELVLRRNELERGTS